MSLCLAMFYLRHNGWVGEQVSHCEVSLGCTFYKNESLGIQA